MLVLDSKGNVYAEMKNGWEKMTSKFNTVGSKETSSNE
jgi:hypothetical protein